MKSYLSPLLLILASHCCAQDRFQLARPLVKYESVFFRDAARLELKFALPGAQIYYTIDHTIPPRPSPDPSKKSSRYRKPLLFSRPFTTVRAKVFCRGFEPSETITMSFAGEGKKIKTLSGTAPHPKYPGSGDSTLFDNKGGIEVLSSRTWMGFNSDSVLLTLELNESAAVSSILLHFLRQEASWIFLPGMITVYYFDESRKTYLPFGREVISGEEASANPVSFRFIYGTTGAVITQKLLIDIRPVRKIPEWHPAKGERAWCFIDEIKVY